MTRYVPGPRCVAAASVLALLTASPALADPSGYVSISGGLDNMSISGGITNQDIDGSAIQVLASGVYMFTPVLGVQGDVHLTWRSFEFDSADMDATSLDGAVHGFYRESDKFLVGGFVQFGGDRLGTDIGNLDFSRNYAGAEGQVYVDSLTLSGQLGLQQIEIEQSGLGMGMDGWFGSLEARYFLTPDFRIDGRLGVSSYDFDLAQTTFTTLSIGVGAEYKLENLPVSLFASYDLYSTSVDMPASPTFDEHRLLVGAKFAIGEDSLLDRDRNGASLRSVSAPIQPFALGGGSPPP